MSAVTIHYRHNHLHQPHYPSNPDIERVAAQVRTQLGLSDRRALTIADLAAISELNVNGVRYDVWLDLEHPVHDEHRNPVFGVFEFTPTSSINAVSVCVSPPESGISEVLRLSTLAHEMGHAIFDGPALVSLHALEIHYGEDTLFAQTPDGDKRIVWSEVTFDLDCWGFTRALAPHFGVSPAFIEVRMMRYGMIPSQSRLH